MHATPTRLDRTGGVKGWDFPQFYVNGRMVVEGRVAELYDNSSVEAATSAHVSEHVDYVYNVYAPHVALLFAPLGLLTYGWALAVWLTISAAVYTWSGRRILATLRADVEEARTLALVMGSSPAWWLTVQYGQLSAVLLALLVAAWSLHARGRAVACGLVLGLLVAKPQLLLPVAAVLVLARELRIVVGIGLSVLAQVGLTALIMGPQPLRDYARVVSSLGSLAPTLQAKSHLLQSFSGFFALLFPASPSAAWTLAFVWSGVAVMVGAFVWRTRRPSTVSEHGADAQGVNRKWLALVCVMALASPHLYVYDLLLLTPAMVALIMGARWPNASSVWKDGTTRRIALGASLCVVPLVSPVVARATAVQITTLLLVCLLYLAARPPAIGR